MTSAFKTSVSHKREQPTAFQEKVYELTTRVPAGKVTTYGEIARALSSSPRAVGNALRNNPFAPKVPCHRVVAKTRELHGFAGQVGDASPNVMRKRKMLTEEGVKFEGNKVAFTCLHIF